jgi:hypothetical protein
VLPGPNRGESVVLQHDGEIGLGVVSHGDHFINGHGHRSFRIENTDFFFKGQPPGETAAGKYKKSLFKSGGECDTITLIICFSGADYGRE